MRFVLKVREDENEHYDVVLKAWGLSDIVALAAKGALYESELKNYSNGHVTSLIKIQVTDSQVQTPIKSILSHNKKTNKLNTDEYTA